MTTAVPNDVQELAKERADWLVDAVACSTQNRMFLRGEKEEDEVATESIYLNGKKAIEVAIMADRARNAPDGGEVEPVASIVPAHCTGSAFVFDPGVLRVNKDGSGYIAIDEDDFACEDDRCEGPDGPEGSVHWITRLAASEITALRDFLNGAPHAPTAPSGTAEVEPVAWVPEDELPESLPTEAYNALFPYSRVDGIRFFPIFAPTVLRPLYAHPPTVELREPYGWKCNCCGNVFTSSQGERSGGEFDSGAACPKCKAGGQYTYRCELHQGDPCVNCGVLHDDAPSGPCPGSPEPALEVREPDAELVRKLLGALCWCSGSSDFLPEGTARRGWLEVAVPAIKEAEVLLSKHGGNDA